jgi:hypothetical protein
MSSRREIIQSFGLFLQNAHDVPVLVDNGKATHETKERLMIQERLSTQSDRANEVLSHGPFCGSEGALLPSDGSRRCGGSLGRSFCEAPDAVARALGV